MDRLRPIQGADGLAILTFFMVVVDLCGAGAGILLGLAQHTWWITLLGLLCMGNLVVIVFLLGLSKE